jgi:dihydroorotase
VRILFRNVRVVDAETDRTADVFVDGERIAAVMLPLTARTEGADLVVVPPAGTVLMPAFVELHAHFRDPGFPEKETLESASLAAVAGGYGTVVCMANTKPVMDSPAEASALKARADALGLVDLYPALSLTLGMAGTDLGGLDALAAAAPEERAAVRLLSEDGKDVADDAVLRAAFKKAAGLGLPVSCHCDLDGEDRATERALALGAATGASVHIAHCSTAASLEAVRRAKARGERVTCEVTPHHLALTEADAAALGAAGGGRVNPPLRTEADRLAAVAAVRDGTADAIATDHAPHTAADKSAGAPGFTGLETAFGVCRTVLCGPGGIDLKKLSELLSSAPARILELADRGLVAPGLRSDLVLVAPDEEWTVDASRFRSRGKNTPYQGRALRGRVRLTLRGGRIVYDSGANK